MSDDQHQFLLDEFFSLTLRALAQRGKLYRKGSNEKSRAAFRNSLRSWLERVTVEQYKDPVADDLHFENIQKFADEMSAAHSDALNGGRLRIGSAQKALNLYLKYMWCSGQIPEPPHCPFDYMVLKYIPQCKHIKWTQLDSMERYKQLVKDARSQAGQVSIAQWELKLYNDVQPGSATRS